MLDTSQRMVRLVGLSIQNAMVIHRSCCAGQVCQAHRWLRKPRALVSSQVLAAAFPEAATLTLSPGSAQLASHAGPLGHSVGPLCWLSSLGPFCAGLPVSLVNTTGLRLLNQQQRQDSPSLQTLSSMPGYTRLSREYRRDLPGPGSAHLQS